MYTAFFEILGQLYWKGYAENLQDEDPKAFDLQYSQFLSHYKN